MWGGLEFSALEQSKKIGDSCILGKCNDYCRDAFLHCPLLRNKICRTESSKKCLMQSLIDRDPIHNPFGSPRVFLGSLKAFHQMATSRDSKMSPVLPRRASELRVKIR